MRRPMRMPARPLLALALAPALVVLALARPAAAFEPTGNAVADGFLRIVESGGFADVAIAGSGHNEKGTVLTGLTASAPGRNERLAIGTVVIVGGMGSIPGAALGALLIGLAEQFGSVYAPTYAVVLTFLIMVVVLAFRPQGLVAVRR